MAKNDGLTHAVFMWWVLYMDREQEIILSCAPKWAHHNPNNMQVRWFVFIRLPLVRANIFANLTILLSQMFFS